MTKTRSQKTEGGIGDGGHGAHVCVALPCQFQTARRRPRVAFAPPFQNGRRVRSTRVCCPALPSFPSRPSWFKIAQNLQTYANLRKPTQGPPGGYGPDIAAQYPCRFQWPRSKRSPTGAHRPQHKPCQAMSTHVKHPSPPGVAWEAPNPSSHSRRGVTNHTRARMPMPHPRQTSPAKNKPNGRVN
jgi:hypothetical protein